MRSSGTMTHHTRRGFTLFELIVTVSIMAMVSLLILPSAGSENLVRLNAAERLIRSDIELVQLLSIASPGDPAVLVLDTDGDRYWIALQSDPALPIIRKSTGEPYIVVFGEGLAETAQGVDLTTSGIPGNQLAFNMTGGLTDFKLTPQIALTCPEKTVTLSVSATTGSVYVVAE